jgi:hypothetical protein
MIQEILKYNLLLAEWKNSPSVKIIKQRPGFIVNRSRE